jgi:putative hemolysin
MDKIYIELLQKDSLEEQAILSHSKEVLLYQVIDSSKKDIESLQSLVYAIDSENMGLHLENEEQKTQIRTNRTISFISYCYALFIYSVVTLSV